MRSKRISVLIADDHALIREGIKQILELEEDIHVVGQANNGEEAFELASKLEPDIILLDINMPKTNGIEALRRFKDMGITSKVIILTIHEDREYILKTLKLGANGYMLKDSSANSLIEGIRRVAKGENYIQSSVADLVSASSDDSMEDKSIEQINSLTNREYEVLMLIAEGLNNKDIAERLYISEKTVKNHVSNIFKKLELNDRVQAAIFAYKNNIIKL
ncbi:MAG: response regulator transcription factor [Tissierellia bacterium]|nr:response regulator transcription factor [Tissierellia bacterium]